MCFGRDALWQQACPKAPFRPLSRHQDVPCLRARAIHTRYLHMADGLHVADELYSAGAFQSAIRQYELLLRQQPQSWEIHYRTAITAVRLQENDRALTHFKEAIRLNPKFFRAHLELARLLISTGKTQQGLEQIRQTMNLAPDDSELAVSTAQLLDEAGETDAAMDITRRLLAQGSPSFRLAGLFARLAPRLKQESQALALIDKVLAQDGKIPTSDQVSLHFAAANLLDRLQQYDAAFERASLANRLRGVQYDPAPADRLARDFTSYFTRPTFRRLPHATHGDSSLVFIVGMPRSGTSLVEQILASHPAVFATGESDRLFRIWESCGRRHADPASPLLHWFDRLSPRDVDELAAQYLEPLRKMSGSATRFTDKSLPNFMYLGLIAILFPLARIIYCRRDPLDTCLSCFMTDFAAGNYFSTSLATTGQYWRQYERMMSHWKDVLNLPMLEVQYEQVVADVEGESRRILKFLDLPWDPQCLRFFENRRVVTTASQAQVREPIYRRSVGRWRNYEKHLGPLRAALGP